MIKLKYLDSYHIERTVSYEDYDEFLLAFSGCVTIPDSFTVLSLTYNDQLLPFQGKIGELYRFMSQFDMTSYKNKKESGTEIGNSLEFDFIVPPPHS